MINKTKWSQRKEVKKKGKLNIRGKLINKNG